MNHISKGGGFHVTRNTFSGYQYSSQDI